MTAAFEQEKLTDGRRRVVHNGHLPEWDQIFKDPMTTAAAIDRVVHHAVILELDVPSYRTEAARRRLDTSQERGD